MGYNQPTLTTTLGNLVTNSGHNLVSLYQNPARTPVSISCISGNTLFTKATGQWIPADGKRISISGTGNPAELPSGTYWVTRVSDTTFRLSSTLANYLAGTFITPSSTVSLGTLLSYDVDLGSDETIASYLSYEFGSGVVPREPVTWPSVISTGTPDIPKVSSTLVAVLRNLSGSTVDITHVLDLGGSSSTTGGTTYTTLLFVKVTGVTSVAAGGALTITINSAVS